MLKKLELAVHFHLKAQIRNLGNCGFYLGVRRIPVMFFGGHLNHSASLCFEERQKALDAVLVLIAALRNIDRRGC